MLSHMLTVDVVHMDETMIPALRIATSVRRDRYKLTIITQCDDL